MSAIMSDDGRYRYQLSREWDEGEGQVCWVMLNPSTADAEKDDNTIRRCIRFSQDWGYRSLVVVNLFPLIATYPPQLKSEPDLYGDRQLFAQCVVDALGSSEEVIAAWGASMWDILRARQISGYTPPTPGEEIRPPAFIPARAAELGKPFNCLGYTHKGDPKHPLYLRSNAERIPWPPTGGTEPES